MRIDDSLTNLTANLGTARDKASHAEYTRPHNQLQLQREYLAAFEYAWLPRRVVTQVSSDAFRKWRDWQATQDQITLIEREEKRLNARQKLEDAYEDARLRGVSYVHIAIRGDETRESEPLNPERVRRGSIKWLTHLTKDDVAEGDIDLDPMSPTYGMPKYYQVANANLVNIHPSRLIIFYGDKKPTRFAEGVEANSVLAAPMPAIKRHDSIVSNVASLVYEARVDVISVPGLQRMLQDPEEYARITARFALMATMKGNNGLVLLNASENKDDPSETWEQKNSTFTTLPDLIEKAQEEVSAAARIPRAILFGTGAGGLGATGELEIRSYYDHIATLQSNEVEPAIYMFDECLIRSALGARPDDVWYRWASLWQMSDEQLANIGDKIASKWQKVAGFNALPIEVLSQVLVNDLTERGVGAGLDQFMSDWLETNDLEGEEADSPEGDAEVEE
jgi:phage-related protein (TIGR01555 family)